MLIHTAARPAGMGVKTRATQNRDPDQYGLVAVTEKPGLVDVVAAAFDERGEISGLAPGKFHLLHVPSLIDSSAPRLEAHSADFGYHCLDYIIVI